MSNLFIRPNKHLIKTIPFNVNLIFHKSDAKYLTQSLGMFEFCLGVLLGKSLIRFHPGYFLGLCRNPLSLQQDGIILVVILDKYCLANLSRAFSFLIIQCITL